MRGVFTIKMENGKLLFNVYECEACAKAGIDHAVANVPNGHTDKRSCWGPGIPTTRRECSVCRRWDGPWVSAAYVGDGW